MVERATGSTFLEIDRRQMALVEVRLPPLAEQHAIARALSDVDGLIEALEALIAKKRAIKRAAIQQLLTGKTRLPGFDRKWRTTSLQEIAEIESGATPDTMNATYWDGTIPWCTPTDVTSTRGKISQNHESQHYRRRIGELPGDAPSRLARFSCVYSCNYRRGKDHNFCGMH